MQKARRHTEVLRPLVGTRFQVLFHSPSGVLFHLSLTVLVRYRSPGSTEPWRVVPPDSDRVSRERSYSGTCHGRPCAFAYGTVTHCGASIPQASANTWFCNFRQSMHTLEDTSYNPRQATRARLHLPGLG